MIGIFYQHLDRVKTRPGMYIGEKTITRMRTHIYGYLTGLEENGITELDGPDFHDFHEYVRNYYGYYESTSGWKNMILDKSKSEEDALNTFFVLLEKFKNGEKIYNTFEIFQIIQKDITKYLGKNQTLSNLINFIKTNPFGTHNQEYVLENYIFTKFKNFLYEEIYGKECESINYQDYIKDLIKYCNGNEILALDKFFEFLDSYIFKHDSYYPKLTIEYKQEQIEILNKLIKYEKTFEELLSELKSIGWTDDVLVTLKPQDIISILIRYLDGKLKNEDVEKWADYIELRDDIEYSYNQDIVEIISELANPLINGGLTKEKAKTFISKIKEKPTC